MAYAEVQRALRMLSVTEQKEGTPAPTYKKISANPQILKSSPEEAHALRLKAPASASFRSRLIRRRRNCTSLGLRKFQAGFCAICSGKLTTKT